MTQDSDYAKMILDIIPPLMRHIRNEMRYLTKSELTVPQFRVLARLSRSTATNRDLAEWVGVSAPTMTRMVDVLVKKNFVKRDSKNGDRRQLDLTLTDKGLLTFRELRSSVQMKLAEKISNLTHERKKHLTDGLWVLRDTFL